jgi:hypothetical protein
LHRVAALSLALHRIYFGSQEMPRIIRTTGKIEEVVPRAGRKFELAELQTAVGGYIELVRTKTGEMMVVNEDGHALGLEFNSLASSLYPGFPPHPIVGDVLICSREELD